MAGHIAITRIVACRIAKWERIGALLAVAARRFRMTTIAIADAEGIKLAQGAIRNLIGAAAVKAPHVAAFSDAADDAAAKARAAFYAREIIDGDAAISALFDAAAAAGYAAGYAAAAKGYTEGYAEGYDAALLACAGDDVVLPKGKRNDGFLDERQKEIANGAL